MPPRICYRQHDFAPSIAALTAVHVPEPACRRPRFVIDKISKDFAVGGCRGCGGVGRIKVKNPTWRNGTKTVAVVVKVKEWPEATVSTASFGKSADIVSGREGEVQ